MKKSYLLFVLFFLRLESAEIYKRFTSKQKANIKAGFLISYLTKNIETLKLSNDVKKISNQAYAFIIMASLINIFRKDKVTFKNPALAPYIPKWDFEDKGEIYELMDNAACNTTGVLLGLITPSIAHLLELLKK